MPVLSKCPLCRAVMPESRRESRCPRCGELVLPAVRKLCTVCGKDVTREKRVLGDDHEYFCLGCWSDRLASRGEEPGYLCSTCHGVFPADQVYQDGEELICHGCFATRNVDPNALMAAAAETGDTAPAVFTPTSYYRRADGPPWGLISVAVALLIVLVVGLIILATR